MSEKYLIRLIGTEDYYSKYAPCGTTKADATRLSKKEAEAYVEQSALRNGGKSKVEMVKV